MDMTGLGPWIWLISGLLLIVLETLAPGVFFVWLGIAAILTGIVDWLVGTTWQVNLLVFAALAVVSVAAGRLLTRRAGEPPEDHRMLNRRAEALIGRIFRLDRPIVSGEGRIRVDDSVWRVVGPDLAMGAAVRVVRIDGASLIVEPAAPL